MHRKYVLKPLETLPNQVVPSPKTFSSTDFPNQKILDSISDAVVKKKAKYLLTFLESLNDIKILSDTLQIVFPDGSVSSTPIPELITWVVYDGPESEPRPVDSDKFLRLLIDAQVPKNRYYLSKRAKNSMKLLSKPISATASQSAWKQIY